jgi:undecaprenyl-diphosphatase
MAATSSRSSHEQEGFRTSSLDLALLHAINGLAGSSAALDGLMRFLANDSPFIVALALLWAWFKPGGQRRSRQRDAALAAVAGVLGIAAAAVIGAVHYRARPFLVPAAHVHLLITHAADSSFPSDHATLAFAVAAGLFAVGADWGWPMLIFGVAVAFARVFVGVHWPSDVVGGAILGVLCAWVVRALAASLNPLLDQIIDALGPLGSPRA